MATAGVRASGRTGTSGATVVGIIALLASEIGLVFSAMFAFGAFAPLFLAQDPDLSGPSVYVAEVLTCTPEIGPPSM